MRYLLAEVRSQEEQDVPEKQAVQLFDISQVIALTKYYIFQKLTNTMLTIKFIFALYIIFL